MDIYWPRDRPKHLYEQLFNILLNVVGFPCKSPANYLRKNPVETKQAVGRAGKTRSEAAAPAPELRVVGRLLFSKTLPLRSY